jgi:cytochrome c553
MQTKLVSRFFAVKIGWGISLADGDEQYIGDARAIPVCDLCHALNDTFGTMQCEHCRIANVPGQYRRVLMEGHPTDEELVRYVKEVRQGEAHTNGEPLAEVRFKLDEDELNEITDHLAVCDDCYREAQGLFAQGISD